VRYFLRPLSTLTRQHLRMRLTCSAIALSLACALPGCSSTPAKSAPFKQQAPAAAQASPKADQIPDVALDEALLYQLLASEIALQRGQPKAAYATYYSLAQKMRDPRLARRAVEIALMDQNLERALESTRLWNELSPDNPQAAQSMTILLVSQGNLDEAEPRLAERLKLEKLRQATSMRDDQIANPYESIQRLMLRAPDRLAAYKVLVRLFENDLSNADALHALASQANAAGLVNEPIDYLKKAQALQDTSDIALTLSQVLQTRDGNSNGAVSVLEGYIKRHPEAEDMQLALGRLHASEKRWVQARKIFEALLTKDDKNPSLLYTLGLVTAQQPDREAARKYFETFLLVQKPGDGRDIITIYFTMSQLAEEARDWADASAWLDRVPDNAIRTDVITRRAGILAKQKQFAKAEQLIALAKPKNEAEKVQLTLSEVSVMRDQDQHQRALKRLESVLSELPDQPDLLYEKAMVAEKLDLLEVLETSLRKVMALRPDNPHAYNALGYTLADRNLRLEEARVLVEKALTLAPDDPFILDSMGWVQFKLGMLKESEATLRKAYQIKPDNEIAIHLGEVLWKQGRNPEALDFWRTVASREPESTALKEVLSRLKATL